VNVFLWGVAAAASAGAQGYRGLLVARIFLGIFEATVGPSLMLISSQYYTRSEQAPRFTVWYMGLGVAQIIGGLISFAFQHVQHASLEGWRIMFLTLGLVTAVVGSLTFLFLPDTPIKASWLSDTEKVALLQHVSDNQTGVWSTTLDLKQIREAALDIQLWLLTVTTILVCLAFCPLLQVPCSCTLYIILTTIAATDIRLQWCRDNIFLDVDCRIWFLRPNLSPS
jgi:MFS family permease